MSFFIKSFKVFVCGVMVFYVNLFYIINLVPLDNGENVLDSNSVPGQRMSGFWFIFVPAPFVKNITVLLEEKPLCRSWYGKRMTGLMQ